MRTTERQNLKHDRFAETAAETYSWAAEHRDKLIYGGVAVAVILALALGFWTWMQRRDDKASVALGAAMMTANAPVLPAGTPVPEGIKTFASSAERGKAAHQEFVKIAEDYSGTNSAKVARYMAGVTALEMGDSGATERDLKEVAGSGDLGALANMALAGLYRTTNREQQAIEIYKRSIEKPTHTVSKEAAQLALASLYETKQPAEAAKIYEEIRKSSPDSPAAQFANMRLNSGK